MHQFKDCEGRTWDVTINVAAVKRLRGSVINDGKGLDLMKLLDDKAKGLGEFLADPVLLIDAIYVLCQEQAEKRKVSDEDFGRAMAGDVLQHAADAWLEEFADFFPEAKGRKNLRSLMTKARTVGNMMQDRAEMELEKLNPETIAESLMSSLTKPPASSESSQIISPSPSLVA